MASVSSKKRTDIQILRAISVLLVLVFHIRWQLLPNGYLGVDVFFFITGFVLFPQIKDLVNSKRGTRISHFRTFLRKRFKRLMPAFVISTIISMIILTLFGSLSAHRAIASQAVASLLFMGNLGAENLSGNYFSPQPNPFLHYWSLSSEWQLYFFVPILISVTQTIFKTTFLRVSTIYLFLFFTIWAIFSTSSSLFNYYSPISRLWEFFLGIFFAHQMKRLENLKNRLIQLFARMIFLASFLIIVSPLEIGTYYGQFIAATLFVSFIISRFDPSYYIKTLLVWVGDRSYSIYLYHLPLVYLSLYSPLSASRFHLRALGTVFCVVIAFFLAHWSYTKVEVRQKITADSINGDYWLSDRVLVKQYLVCIIISISLFAASSIFYGPYQGSMVDVAWKRYPRCTSSDVTPCISPNIGSDKKIVLVGDSHADHFIGVMRNLSARTNAHIYYLGYRVENYIQDSSFEKSLNKINPSLVIVSQFNRDILQKDNFRESLNLMQDRGIKVLFIADNPHFSDYLHYLHHVNPSFTSVFFVNSPMDEVDALELENNSRIVSSAYLEVAKLLNVEYLDLYKSFCPQDICLRKIDGQYLFYDNHHLSVKGAEFVQEELIEKVNKLLSFT
jgi:peptidoglycan/LPS O-acetylase OafA/YrhL